MSENVIELVNVRRYYIVGDFCVKALDGVSCAIKKGSFTAIMGPSGSGKSTMMNLIGCLDTPTSGFIKIGGEYTNNMNENELADIRNRRVGFVFQQFNLLGKQNALENVMTPLLYAGVSGRERKERAEALLERVGLKERMKHLPSELSGGLDSKTGDQIMELFQDINDEGRTVVFVTHDRGLGMRCKDQIYIHDGKIVEGY